MFRTLVIVALIFSENLNLILGCKTRWNSLISMIDRFLTVRKPLCKAMIDINMSIEICERDWQVLENVLSILKTN